jgi:ectoine hydroxylase-related dioxygenase (phytanoyl-CoA dioxygenase family)
MPDIDANRATFDIVSWDMAPGDVLVFDPLVVHGSPGNASATTRRRALASRWAGDDVTYLPQPHTMPLPEGHGLSPGARLGGSMFPEVLTG